MAEETDLIRIKISTKKKLDLFGKFGESYDDVINKLIGIKDGKKYTKTNNKSKNRS